MVAFYPHFVSCGEKATLKDVVGESFLLVLIHQVMSGLER